LEPNTPHIVLEPLPALDPDLLLTLNETLVVTGSHEDEEKPSVGFDGKPKLKNKGKKKVPADFAMDGVLLDRRLSALGSDFGVDNNRITHHQVGPNSRATMSYIFGGNRQKMISYPSPEKTRVHGFTHPLLFPNRKFNSLLPTKIGERGLLLRLDQKLDKWVDTNAGVGPYHLIMHRTSEDYCYFGVYQFVRVNPVTRDEWLAQTPTARFPSPG
jgi:hypothetical protein